MFSPASGEIWRVRLDDGQRRVRVLAAAGVSGWWRCVDLATDIYVLVPENCFVEAERAATSPICISNLIVDLPPIKTAMSIEIIEPVAHRV